MRIISEKALREFWRKHPDAAASLLVWRSIVRKADWRGGADVRATFSNADTVGDKTVFDIAGNRYRLIAFINFPARRLYIKGIMGHKEYDKGDWKR